MTALSSDQCYTALLARDRRYDGRFFVGVSTTGIYCRPICPARTPKRENITFYPSAASAQSAGLRPCLRCRPETAPGTPAWQGTAASVGRAMRLIDEGALDHGGVEQLAARLGLGARQLSRLFQQHVGASPIAVAQTRRILIAKQLLHDTDLPVTDIAFAAGFGSLRRFNELFSNIFATPPRMLRDAMNADRKPAGGVITLNLAVRPPYDWAAMLAFWRYRAIAGVELVEDDTYARTFQIGDANGTLKVSHPNPRSLRLEIASDTLSILPTLVSRVRRQFDCDADPDAINTSLSKDPVLAPMIQARPGLRVPGAFDPFESGVRAILGQQVTVKAAVGLFGQLVSLCDETDGKPAPLRRTTPTPDTVATTDLSALKMPRARIAALQAYATLCAQNPTLWAQDPSLVREKLLALPGIGPWTADYIAVRALGDPDGFASGDVALQRVLSDGSGNRPDAAMIEAQSQAWRPWRAYAAQHLWTQDATMVAAAAAQPVAFHKPE